jgi:hypothetical protein
MFHCKRSIPALTSVLFATAAFATPPVAPEVIEDAAPRQVLFDWNYVPKANWYEVWFKANDGAAWAKLGERPSYYPHLDVNVSAHLLDWFGMRWDVRACNPGGCSPPRSINIGSTVWNTIGYVKAAQPRSHAAFGAAVDLSEDGRTLAVVASREPVDDANGSGTATVYLYRGTPNNWRAEARLRPALVQAENGAGAAVSLSRDGNALALGLPAETSVIDGVDAAHGAVHVFRRDTSGWHEEQRLAPGGATTESAGAFTRISDDGNTLVFTTLNRNADGSTSPALQVYKHGEAGWVAEDPITPSAPYDEADFNMAGDASRYYIRTRAGTELTIRSYETRHHYPEYYHHEFIEAGYELSGFDVDTTGHTVASGIRPVPVAATAYDPAQWKPYVRVYEQIDTIFRQRAELVPSRFQPKSYAKRSLFGDRVAVSGNGSYVAVYDAHDARNAPGVQQPSSASYDSDARGSVYLFEKKFSSYRQRRHIGPNSPTSDQVDGQGVFGALAFGNDGKALAVAAPLDNGGLGGISRAADSEAHDTSAPDAGAVWLY